MRRTGRIVVTCTSTHDRFEYLFYAVTSILRQSVRPDVIYINLPRISPRDRQGEGQGIIDIPEWFGHELIEPRYMNNHGPYQKLISVYEVVSSDDLVVTIDDDVIYQREWLAKVVTAAERYPNAVICGRARVISQNVLGRWKSYHHWPHVHHITYAFWILPVGCAGMAYRKSLLCEAFLRDRQCLSMASVNEDLWFRTASLLEGSYVYVDPRLHRGNIVLSNKALSLKDAPSFKSQPWLTRAWLAVKLSALGYFGAELGKSDKAWRTVNQYLLHYCAMSDPFHDDIDEGRDRRIVKKKYPSRIK